MGRSSDVFSTAVDFDGLGVHRLARGSGDLENVLGEKPDGGLAVEPVHAERGLDRACGRHVQGVPLGFWCSLQHVGGRGQREAPDQRTVVGEGVVDEAAELLAGGSDLGASGVVQAGQGGVLG